MHDVDFKADSKYKKYNSSMIHCKILHKYFAAIMFEEIVLNELFYNYKAISLNILVIFIFQIA